jgi:hypothetical protein
MSFITDSYNKEVSKEKIEKNERISIINIDSRYRSIEEYPHVNNFTMDFPRTFNNISEIGIASLELPNTVSVFNNRNNKIRWKNKYGFGCINSVQITTSDPVTGTPPGVGRTDKFIKFTVDGSVEDEVKVGDIVKIVGLYLNTGENSTIPYNTDTVIADQLGRHLIGNNCTHSTTSNSHSGKFTSVANSTVMTILPNHYYANNTAGTTYTTWRKWGTSGNNQYGEANDYYNNWKLLITSGTSKNEVRRVSDYTNLTRTLSIESAFSTTPLVNDTYQLLNESNVVYKSAGDTISTGTVAHNEFWVIDFKTSDTLGGTGTNAGNTTYSSSIGYWYHDRDENDNYISSTQNNINLASIGSKARWFTESSNAFGKSLAESMAISKYKNLEIPKFDIKLNDNNEMITFKQYYMNKPSKWLKYWKYDDTQLGGPIFTVAGENILSCIYPSHGLDCGNIIGVIKYPPTDSYNNWQSTSLENGWPVSDLHKDLYGCAMIITNKSVSDWGEKNKFEKDMEIEILNSANSQLNGIHRIKYVPKVGYRLNLGNSAPCYCFVIPMYIDSEIPSTYSSNGSKVIKSTNINGTYGMRIDLLYSTGLSGAQLNHINMRHTILGKGIIKETSSGMGYEYDRTYKYYTNDSFIIRIPSISTVTNSTGGGGLRTMYQTELPFKFVFNNYIDDLGPNLGLTDGNNRKDTDEWMRVISNTYDKTIYTDVKIPARISGDNYFYISIDNLTEHGFHSEYSAIHDNKYSGGHILTKVLITMGSGEMLFNTQIGGVVGGESPIIKFDRFLRSLDKIKIGLYRKLSNVESQPDLEKFLKKSYEVSVIMKVNKILNKTINEVSTGIIDTIMQLKNKNDLIPHIILGKGNNKTRNEKWQFNIEKIEADSSFNGYKVILKIYSQRIIYFDRESSLEIPLDPIDIANYIYNNIPTNSTIHPSDDMIYLRNIISIEKIGQISNPPKGFDYLDINNVDYSLSLYVKENI